MGQSEDKDTSDENKNDAGTTAVNVTDAGLEMATDAGVTPVTDSGVSPLPTDAGSMVPPMDAGSLAEVTDSGNNAPAPCTDTCADLGHSCVVRSAVKFAGHVIPTTRVLLGTAMQKLPMSAVPTVHCKLSFSTRPSRMVK